MFSRMGRIVPLLPNVTLLVLAATLAAIAWLHLDLPSVATVAAPIAILAAVHHALGRRPGVER